MKKWLAFLAGMLLAGSLCLSAAAAPEDAPLLLVMGDSIAYGQGLTDPVSQCYGALVAEREGYVLQNRAVNGYMTRDLLNLLQFNDSLKEQAAQADLLVISIGGNDFLRQVDRMARDLLHGELDTLDGILRELEDNLDSILTRLRELNPEAPILLQTLYNPFYNPLRGACAAMIDRLNGVYRDYLQEHPGAYRLLDVAAAFEGHPEYISSDNIHPSQEGHQAIARVLTAYLEGEDQPVVGPGPTLSGETGAASSSAETTPPPTGESSVPSITETAASGTGTAGTLPSEEGAGLYWLIPACIAGAGMLGAVVLTVRRRKK